MLCYPFPTLRLFKGSLSSKEFDYAPNSLIRLVQSDVWSREISRLKSRKSLSKVLRELTPLIEKNHILRVGGRLANSDLRNKHFTFYSILLPGNQPLTNIIIQCYQRVYLH